MYVGESFLRREKMMSRMLCIHEEALNTGIYLGFQLSRLEWIWGSPYKEAIEVFEEAKDEIVSLVRSNQFYINDNNYKSFSQSILNHYMSTDIDMYVAILIGFTLQRCCLIGASKKSKNNEELYDLARSVLVSAPESKVPNRDKLFDLIFENRDMGPFELRNYLVNLNNPTIEGLSDEKKGKQEAHTLFLSYCQVDSIIADFIEENIKKISNNKIHISRDIRLEYRASFKEFMHSIHTHDFVLCLVSDNYLKSFACMYEVGEIISDPNFKDKILFVILDESAREYYLDKARDFVAADIYENEEKRLKYIHYWKEKYNALNQEINSIKDNEATMRAVQSLKEIGRIYRNDIQEFLAYLAQHNGKSFQTLYDEKFATLVNIMIK